MQRERVCETHRYCIQFLINVLGGRHWSAALLPLPLAAQSVATAAGV